MINCSIFVVLWLCRTSWYQAKNNTVTGSRQGSQAKFSLEILQLFAAGYDIIIAAVVKICSLIIDWEGLSSEVQKSHKYEEGL